MIYCRCLWQRQEKHWAHLAWRQRYWDNSRPQTHTQTIDYTRRALPTRAHHLYTNTFDSMMPPQRGWGHPWHQSEMESSTCSQLTAGSERKTLHKRLYLSPTQIMHLYSMLRAVVLLWWQQTGRKDCLQSETIKKPRKPNWRKKRGQWGGSVRHTNPYLKRWRLIQLPQQSQHSGNDGLWEVEGRQKAIIWCPGTRWDLNHWVCRDKHI